MRLTGKPGPDACACSTEATVRGDGRSPRQALGPQAEPWPCLSQAAGR